MRHRSAGRNSGDHEQPERDGALATGIDSGSSRPDPPGDHEIAQALESEGIRATPPLPGAQLDDEVQLEIAGARGGVLKRTLRGGLKVWQVLVGLLGLAATITALISFTQESLPHPSHAPPPLHGDLNIMVADFAAEKGGARSTRSREGDDVALSLYHSLDTRLHLQPRQPGNEEPLRHCRSEGPPKPALSPDRPRPSARGHWPSSRKRLTLTLWSMETCRSAQAKRSFCRSSMSLRASSPALKNLPANMTLARPFAHPVKLV